MATEKRLIDANEFLNWLVKRFHCIPLVGSSDKNSESMKFLLSQAPTVDAVEVVRCKDCKEWLRNRGVVDSPNGHCFYHETHMNGYDFCSYGERKCNDI